MRVWWSDGKHWLWKDVEEQLNYRVVEETVKFGGDVMMWVRMVRWGRICNQDCSS